METFILVGGLFLLIGFSTLRSLLSRSEPKNRKSLSGITFFQLLGLGWTLLGIAFQTKVILYPKGGVGVLVDILLFLVPVWAFAFYLERREKKR